MMKKSSYCRFLKKLEAVTPIETKQNAAKMAAYWPGIMRRKVDPDLTKLWMNNDACSSTATIVVYPAQR